MVAGSGGAGAPVSSVASPAADEFAPYYGRYIERVAAKETRALLAELAAQPAELAALFARVPAERERFAYAPGKWSLRQVASHLIDAERVFGFRAFCFSRRDEHPLPSFEENDYVARADADALPLAEQMQEFKLVRESNLTFLRRLTPAEWTARGTASGNTVSVRALAWILAGHPRHHIAGVTANYAAALR